MSYPYTSSSVSATNPFRRSAGLIFVVTLHIAAIMAIKVGLGVSVESPPFARTHVVPIFDRPAPPPLPTEPVVLKFPTKTIITMPEPSLPPEIITTEARPSITTPQSGNTEGPTRTDPVLVTARVDPSHPLTQPAYPAASKRFNEQGRVELMLYILADGKVGEARIAQSSGHARLDESALREALRSWRFIPQQENGISMSSWQRFAITFRLEN